MVKSFPILILLSGKGSNAQAIIQAQSYYQSYQVIGVISDQAQAGGLRIAQQHNLPTYVLPDTDQYTREQQLVQHIDTLQPKLIVLAGYMRILSPTFAERYLGQCLNIHPSLLPKHPGLDTHARVLAALDSHHGCTIHYVTATVDAGPIIAQSSTKVLKQHTQQTLQQTVQTLEHQLYPQIIDHLAHQKIKLVSNTVYFEQKPLPPNGLQRLCNKIVKTQ